MRLGAQQQADAAPRNPFEGNPALALAYNAALTAIESSGPGPGAPPFVGSQAPLLPPMPHNPYLLQQPLLYLPAYSLVRAPYSIHPLKLLSSKQGHLK